MKNYFKALLLIFFACTFVWLLWFLSHDGAMPILQPKGAIALQERNLIFIAMALMLAIVIPVFALTAIISWRYRATNTSAKYLPNWEHNVTEEFIWWAVPCVIIVILAGITWKSSHTLDPFQPLPGKSEVIEVVALDWKWLFLYPKENIATVNYVEFPVGQPVEFRITSDAPMNSFWIPQLSGQIYAMTGMVTQLHLVADAPGIYAGSSANISGKGFAGMTFAAKAVMPDEFQRWASSTEQSPDGLDGAAYGSLLQPSMNEPARYYGRVQPGLFDRIVSQYDASMPMNMQMSH
jgi:cytochrome o ubiquinol oxidase subunit 2